jgi:hypothetical protein
MKAPIEVLAEFNQWLQETWDEENNATPDNQIGEGSAEAIYMVGENFRSMVEAAGLWDVVADPVKAAAVAESTVQRDREFSDAINATHELQRNCKNLQRNCEYFQRQAGNLWLELELDLLAMTRDILHEHGMGSVEAMALVAQKLRAQEDEINRLVELVAAIRKDGQ